MSINENVETKPSVCPLDCPDTCSLSVKTDGVHVLEVRGSEANPYTAGDNLQQGHAGLSGFRAWAKSSD